MEHQFLQLPNKLLTLKDPIAVLTYAIIDNQKTLFPFDKTVELPVSCIAYNTMVDHYKIRKASAIEAVNTLKDNGLIDYKQIPTGRDRQVFNQYSFPLIGKGCRFKEIYKEVDTSVLKLDLTSKEKGILLMLHILATDTEDLIMSDEEMAKQLGMTVRTLNKYIKLFTAKKLLFKNKHHYSLREHITNNLEPLTITL